MFNFIRNRQLFSNKALLFCMSIINKWEFLLLLILASIYYCHSFCPSTLTIEIGVLWYFTVVLAYSFLVTNYTEHLFMCLFVSHISYLMRYLFKPFVCVCVLVTQSCLTLCNPMDSLVPLSMESSRQEYWSGLQFPSSGNFWIHGMTGLLHWQADSLPPGPSGKPFYPHLTGCIVF